MKKRLFTFALLLAMPLSFVIANEGPKKIVVKEQPAPLRPGYKPHTPSKPLVEAWLDDTVLSIEFIEPQGGATLSLSNADVELESVTFSSEVPFVIDLTPYPDAETFTIETEIS